MENCTFIACIEGIGLIQKKTIVSHLFCCLIAYFCIVPCQSSFEPMKFTFLVSFKKEVRKRLMMLENERKMWDKHLARNYKYF